MANYLETARDLKEELRTIMTSVNDTKAALGKLLDTARRNEGKLIDREEAQKAENEGKTIVVLLPDSGDRDLSTALYD